jgi:hypothetical protein
MKTRVLRYVAALAAAVALAACGGGNSGNGAAPATTSGASPTTYAAVALAGEMVSYTIDTAQLTYRYTITASQYGLAGVTRSGNLVRNADGTYAPVGMVNGLVVARRDGLLLGAIRESFDGNLKTVPVIGTANPAAALDPGVATYDYTLLACPTALCEQGYGTFRVDTGGTWGMCVTGNLASGCCGDQGVGNPCTGMYLSGTLNPLGAGQWQLVSGSGVMGNALVFHAGGRSVLVVDITGTLPGIYSPGMLIGSTQQLYDATQANGTWASASTSVTWSTFTVDYTDIAYLTVDGAPSTATVHFTANYPYAGFASWQGSTVGFLASSGVYAAQGLPGRYTEIGVRLD